MRILFLTFSCLLVASSIVAQNPLLLKDVYPGSTGSNPTEIVRTSGYTFFNAEDDDADTDKGLYRTDGTPGGTIKLNLTYPTYASTIATKLTALGNKIVFAGDNLAGYGEIWSSDGTQAGTIAIERFLPANGTTVPVVELKAWGSYVYYSVIDSSNHALLKRTDGTIAGTSVVYNFSAFSGTPEVVFLTPHKGLLYFIVYDAGGTGYDQLWRSDGTQAGTYMVYNWGATRFVQGYLMSAGDYLYCIIGDYSNPRKNYLWRSNGTQAGTVELKQIGTNITGANNLYPPYAAIGSTLYFAGLDATYGKELWKTDGSDTGTVRVTDINPGAGHANPTLLKVMNNQLYFVATGDTVGSELWKYSGNSLSLVKDIYPGASGSSIASMAVSGNRLVFGANGNNGAGTEIWTSDGTTAGTLMAANINPGATNSGPALITDGQPSYLSATTASYGNEVYKFDAYNINNSHKHYVNDNSTTGDIYTIAVGSNTNTGTITAPFASIQAAATAAAAGDTIYVDAGNYVEQVTLQKGLTIIGAGSTKSHLSRPDSIYASPDFPEKGLIQTIQNIGDVHISHMHITGDVNLAPIIIQSGGSVRNCFTQSGNQGIFFRVESTPKTAIIENCRIHARSIAVNFSGSKLTSKLFNNELNVSDTNFATTLFAGLDFNGMLSLEASNNSFSGFRNEGILTRTGKAIINNNSFSGSGKLIQQYNDTVLTQATCNWWGTTIADSIAPRFAGAVSYKPFLNNGWDNDTSAIGFQPSPGSCNGGGTKRYVNDGSTGGSRFTSAVGNDANPGTASAPWASLAYAINASTPGDSIMIDAGLYNNGVWQVNKPLTILGVNYDISPNDPANPSQPNGSRLFETEIQSGGGTMVINVSNVAIKGLAFNSVNSSSIIVLNKAVDEIVVENNYFAASNTTVINLSGPVLPDTAQPTAGDFYLYNNRFDKISTGSGTSVLAASIKNLVAYGNSFVIGAGSALTQTAFALGQAGIVQSATISANYFHLSNYDVFSYKLQNGTFANNKSFHSNRAFFLQSANSMPSAFSITGNELTVSGLAPRYSVGIFAVDSIYKNSAKLVDISNNKMTIDATGSLFAQNPISVGFYTPSTNTTFTCRNNKVVLSGSYAAQSTSFGVHGISVAGRAKEIVIESNELSNAGTNIPNVPKPDTAQQLVHSGIYILTDNGPTSMLAEGTLDINHNIINGFKQSVAFYDGVTTHDPYKGYGNLKGGYQANINYNSFGSDSISINNGSVGQMVNATCNWYNTTDLATIGNKVSKSTVRYTPILTGGDQSPSLGYQPPANSCISITDFAPSEGTPGLLVQIKGAGFSGTTQVAFNGTNASFSVTNDSTIAATVPAGAHTGTLMVTKASGSIISAQNFMVLPEPSADSVGICPGSNSMLVSNIIGNTYQWQMQTDSGMINIVDGPNFIGATNDSLRLLDVPTEWNGRQIRCQVNGGSYSKTFTLKVVNYWTGNGNDSNWNNPLNWGCSGQVPDINTDVIISAGAVQLSGNVEAKSIWATPGTNVTVKPGTQLIIKPQ